MVRLMRMKWARDNPMSEKTSKRVKDAANILGNTLDTFWKQTSISGISNAGIAKSNLRTGCWLLIFAVFGALTLYGFQDVVSDYRKYPVTTSIYIEHQNQVLCKNYIVI